VTKTMKLPKKYVRPLFQELLRDKEKREELLTDLRNISEQRVLLRNHITALINKHNELYALSKDNEEAHITQRMGIYACFGWILIQTEEITQLFKDMQVDNEFVFMAETFLDIIRKEAKKMGYTGEEILS